MDPPTFFALDLVDLEHGQYGCIIEPQQIAHLAVDPPALEAQEPGKNLPVFLPDRAYLIPRSWSR